MRYGYVGDRFFDSESDGLNVVLLNHVHPCLNIQVQLVQPTTKRSSHTGRSRADMSSIEQRCPRSVVDESLDSFVHLIRCLSRDLRRIEHADVLRSLLTRVSIPTTHVTKGLGDLQLRIPAQC